MHHEIEAVLLRIMKREPNSYASLWAGVGLGCICEEEVTKELIEIAKRYPNSNAARSALMGIGIISAKRKDFHPMKDLLLMKPNVGETLGLSIGLAGLQNPSSEISERLRHLLATNPSRSVGLGLGLATAVDPNSNATNVMIDYLKNNPNSDASILIDLMFKDPSTPAACGATAGLSVMVKQVGETACDALINLLQKYPESSASDYVCGSLGFVLAEYPERSRRVVELLESYPTSLGAGCMGWCLGVVGAINRDIKILDTLVSVAESYPQGSTIDGLAVGIGMIGARTKEERIINSLRLMLETYPTLRIAEGAAVGLGLIGSQYQRNLIIPILERVFYNLPDKWAGHGAGLGIGFASCGSGDLSISRTCLNGIQQFHSFMRSEWLGISLGLIHSSYRNILPYELQSSSMECLVTLVLYGFIGDWSFLSCALTSIAESLKDGI